MELQTLAALLTADLGVLGPSYACVYMPAASLRTEMMDLASGTATYVPHLEHGHPYPSVVIRDGDAVISTMTFFDESESSSADRLSRALDQMQIDVIEHIRAPWPQCPAHEHPRDLVVRDDRLAWVCPVQEDRIAWFGELSRRGTGPASP